MVEQTKQCKKGYSCGAGCINVKKVCRKELTGQSVQLADNYFELAARVNQTTVSGGGQVDSDQTVAGSTSTSQTNDGKVDNESSQVNPQEQESKPSEIDPNEALEQIKLQRELDNLKNRVDKVEEKVEQVEEDDFDPSSELERLRNREPEPQTPVVEPETDEVLTGLDLYAELNRIREANQQKDKPEPVEEQSVKPSEPKVNEDGVIQLKTGDEVILLDPALRPKSKDQINDKLNALMDSLSTDTVKNNYSDDVDQLAALSQANQEALNRFSEAKAAVAQANKEGRALTDEENQAYDDAYMAIQPYNKEVGRTMKGILNKLSEDSISDDEADVLVNRILENSTELTPEQKESMRKPMRELAKITNGKGLPDKLLNRGGRAYVDSQNKFINVGENKGTDLKKALFHETGHLLEEYETGLNQSAQEFVMSHSTGQQKSLRELTGQNSFNEDEKAYEGNFIDPYVGKIYDDGMTEVFSMGLELFASKEGMTKLYTQDKEHFMFILNTLAKLRDS